jgi:saccharopine dehydrogenase (NADP+, L-glutamate forming)
MNNYYSFSSMALLLFGQLVKAWNMRNILLLGAGKSSAALIRYLLDRAVEEDLMLTVADLSSDAAANKLGGHRRGHALAMDIQDGTLRRQAIINSDLVISLLPTELHVPVAMDCIATGKPLITASYVSADMQALHDRASRASILLMNECGLDPGLDHMSAMQLIHRIKQKGGVIESFRSYTGGLITPESATNPWNYKFTWNPRNVILAGSQGARFLENGLEKRLTHVEVFEKASTVEIEGHGQFDAYANRDSLNYINLYELDQARTILRGTLRHRGFCRAWSFLIKLGLTDDQRIIQHDGPRTWADLITDMIPDNIRGDTIQQRVAAYLNVSEQDESLEKLSWTGIFDRQPLPLTCGTPACMLQLLLEEKWKLEEKDRDMVVMYHEIIYRNVASEAIRLISSLVVKGQNSVMTAMALTVGLPLGITALLILNKKIHQKGVAIPVMPEVYNPVLESLKKHGIEFTEKESVLAM